MFIETAYAQAAGAVKAPSMLEQLLPMLFIFVVFYFLLIRPQSKRAKKHQEFISQLKRGEPVLTSSGILGTVEGITDKWVTLEVADGVRMKILKAQVAGSAKEVIEG
jgi:preprotein translocase subunit YajC